MTADEKHPPIHCLMLGVGGRPFIDDWATAASLVARVTGASRSANPPSIQTEIPVYPLQWKKVRPSRTFSKVNATQHAKAVISAIQQASRDRGPVDLIHSHFAAAASGVPAAARALGIPFVHTEHSSAFINPDQPPSKVGLEVARQVFEAASRVFLVSEPLFRAVRERGLSGRFEVLHNPVNNLIFRPPPHHVPGLSIVTVGNLIPLKRHDLFLRSLVPVFHKHPEARASIIGDGPEYNSLRNLASRLDISNRVSFFGSLPRIEVARLLAESDIYVHTATVETFGVSIVEALLTGLPVVATDSGGVIANAPPELGVAVVEADPALLANAIVKATSQDTWQARQQRAHMAGSLWGLESVAPRLGQVYREVVGKL